MFIFRILVYIYFFQIILFLSEKYVLARRRRKKIIFWEHKTEICFVSGWFAMIFWIFFGFVRKIFKICIYFFPFSDFLYVLKGILYVYTKKTLVFTLVNHINCVVRDYVVWIPVGLVWNPLMCEDLQFCVLIAIFDVLLSVDSWTHQKSLDSLIKNTLCDYRGFKLLIYAKWSIDLQRICRVRTATGSENDKSFSIVKAFVVQLLASQNILSCKSSLNIQESLSFISKLLMD